MTRHEINLFKEFLEELDDYFGYVGCNDYSLDDTPENRLLYEEIQKEMEDDDPDYEFRSAEDCVKRYGNLLMMDWQLFDLLKGKVLKELENAIDA